MQECQCQIQDLSYFTAWVPLVHIPGFLKYDKMTDILSYITYTNNYKIVSLERQKQAQNLKHLGLFIKHNGLKYAILDRPIYEYEITFTSNTSFQQEHYCYFLLCEYQDHI